MNQMAGKADFSDTYVQPLPDFYFAALNRHDYAAPDTLIPYLRQLLSWSQANGYGRSMTILDIGASYGVTAMALRTGLGFHDLARHFADHGRAARGVAELIDADRRFFASFPAGPAVTALDASRPALDYASAVGLAARVVACDPNVDRVPPLEFDGPVAIVSSGTLGYIAAGGLGAILRAVRAPAVAGILIVSRTLSANPFIAACGHGTSFTVRELPTPLRQRRFIDPAEQQAAIRLVAERRPGAALHEEDGWVYASPLLFASEEGAPWLMHAR